MCRSRQMNFVVSAILAGIFFHSNIIGYFGMVPSHLPLWRDDSHSDVLSQIEPCICSWSWLTFSSSWERWLAELLVCYCPSKLVSHPLLYVWLSFAQW